MKYVIDVDFSDNDCSFCPCFEREGKDGFCRVLAIDCGTGDIYGEMRHSDKGDWLVNCFDRPDWCPLVPYDEIVVSELIDSINSQSFSDEPKETIRVELYKSENEKLGAMSIANGLSVAQMVAKLIGDAWTMWHE